MSSRPADLEEAESCLALVAQGLRPRMTGCRSDGLGPERDEGGIQEQGDELEVVEVEALNAVKHSPSSSQIRDNDPHQQRSCGRATRGNPRA